MLTNKFYTMVKPFFNSRWWSELASNDMIDNYVNLCIQDIYNRHSRYFKNVNETIVTSTPHLEWYKKWTTTFNIETIVQILDQDNNQFNPSFRRIETTWDDFADVTCNVWENFIITKDDVEEIYVEYIRSHKWFTYEENKNLELPLPNKFIPPLLLMVFDYASPLSYFEDDNVTPRYEIAEKQLTFIKNNDWITESVYIWPSKGY